MEMFMKKIRSDFENSDRNDINGFWKFLIGLAVFLVFYILFMGKILLLEDEIKKADAIVVMQGEVPLRILEAVDLYNEKQADKIIMVETHKPAELLLEDYGVEVKLSEKLNQSIAEQLGIPSEDIIIVPGAAKSTKEESLLLREYLMEKEGIETLIMVTSKSHSHRAKLIMRDALEELPYQVEIVSVPSKYDDFSSNEWFKHREQIEEVVYESIKLMHYFLIEHWTF